MDMRCDLNPYPYSNCLFNFTNYLINWEYWSEHYSSSLEQYCESYKSVVFELKSIRDSILCIIFSTCYHIYKVTTIIISATWANCKYHSMHMWENIDTIIQIIESQIYFTSHKIDLYDSQYCSKEDEYC